MAHGRQAYRLDSMSSQLPACIPSYLKKRIFFIAVAVLYASIRYQRCHN